MRTILLSIIILLFSIALQAQEFTLSGTVSDEEYPLPGATVFIKGTQKGTTTDFDGNFTISANTKDILVVSYVGYTSQEIELKNKETLNITLDGSIALDEIVIESYGIKKKQVSIICCQFYTHCSVETTTEEDDNKREQSTETALVSSQPLLYPNPSPNGQFQLRLDKTFPNGSLIVSTLTGQQVFQQQFKKDIQNISLDLSSNTNGMYLVSFYHQGKLVITKKALKQY